MFERDCLIAFLLVKSSQPTTGRVVCGKYWLYWNKKELAGIHGNIQAN